MQTTRRSWLTTVSGVAAAVALPGASQAATVADDPFTYCLNTATIRGQKLTLEQEIEVAGKAGYQAIEPWIEKLENYAKSSKLSELNKRLNGTGDIAPSLLDMIQHARTLREIPATVIAAG